MRFEIEFIARDRRYFIARQLDAGELRLPLVVRPGGALVRAFDVPRALDAEGRPRRDLFVFEVSTTGRSVGEIVDIESLSPTLSD